MDFVLVLLSGQTSFVLMVILSIFNPTNGNGNDSNGDWTENIIPSNYWKLSPPEFQIFNGLKKTNVSALFNPKSIMSMDPRTMDFVVHLTLMVYWRDDRLVVPPDLQYWSSAIVDLSKVTAAKLWTPVIQLKNCKGCTSQPLDPNTQQYQLYSKQKYVVVQVTDILKFACTLDLKNYPFDKQKCKVILELRSRLNTETSIVAFGVIRRDIQDYESIHLPPEFLLKAITFNDCSNYSIPNHNCIEYIFHFRRLIAHHVMVVFMPSQMLVILSWVSFWLDIEVAAPRVALPLTTLLTLSTQFNNAQRNLPAVSYIKALDIWMFTCMFMVFSSLVEFAIANNLQNRQKSCASSCKLIHIRSQSEVHETETRSDQRKNEWSLAVRKWARKRVQIHFPLFHRKVSIQQVKRQLTPTKSRPSAQNIHLRQVSSIDRVARVAFPTVFVVFNAIYWGYYKD